MNVEVFLAARIKWHLGEEVVFSDILERGFKTWFETQEHHERALSSLHQHQGPGKGQ